MEMKEPYDPTEELENADAEEIAKVTAYGAAITSTLAAVVKDA
jgi:hypothetical protein